MEKGDHLVSPRIGYIHHGLYIGSGQVIHYSGFSEILDKGSIEVTSIEDFTQENSCRVKNHLGAIYDAEERVERAYSKLGEDSYNLIFNNCEHFVTWCFNGIKSSSQINSALSTAATVANEYMKRNGAETAISAIAHQTIRETVKKTTEVAVTSAVAKAVASNAVGTAAGLTAASAVTGTTAAGVVSVIAAGSIASAVAPVAMVVGVGYGVKKAFDWLF